MSIEADLKALREQHDELWKWTSNLASIALCLVEDRLEDENLSDEEKENYRKLLKEI